MALASSAKPAEMQHYLELLDVGDRVDATVNSGDVEQSKPAPDIFAVACQKLAVAPTAAIAVGDSIWDGETARRVGMSFVGLGTGGFAGAALYEARAQAVYRDLPELLRAWDSSPFGRQI